MSKIPFRPTLARTERSLAERVGILEAITPTGGIDVTDGVLDVNPTTVLLIGPGLVLHNPVAGEAEILAADDTAIEELNGATTTTIASGGLDGFVDFQKVAGATLLDLTAPAAPAFLVAGEYAISITVQIGEKLNAGKSCRGYLIGVLAGFAGQGPAIPSQYIGDGTIGSPLPFLGGSTTFKASAGDSFVYQVGNDDSISHTFKATHSCFVTRLS